MTHTVVMNFLNYCSYFTFFPNAAPPDGSEELTDLRRSLDMPDLPGGDDRSAKSQAIIQLVAMVVTFMLALITGVITGKEKNVN